MADDDDMLLSGDGRGVNGTGYLEDGETTYFMGLVDSIEKNGIKRPIHIKWSAEGGFYTPDGMHRLAAADYLSRNGFEVVVPVVWDPAIPEFRTTAS